MKTFTCIVQPLFTFDVDAENVDEARSSVKEVMSDEHNIYSITDDEIDAFEIVDGESVMVVTDIIENEHTVFEDDDDDDLKDDDDESESQGHCPVCGGADLNYGSIELDGEQAGYPWICSSCNSQGVEWYSLSFNEHVVSRYGTKSRK